jgi:hypothetical protein
MNRFTAAALVALLSISTSALAQENLSKTDYTKPARPKNAIYVGPIALVTQYWHAEYERAVTDNVSLWLSPTYHNGSIELDLGDGLALSKSERSMGVDFGARYFFFGEAPTGFYAGPLLSALQSSMTYRDSDDDVTSSGFVFNVGGQLGYTFLLGNIFAISLGGGAGYGFTTAEPRTVTVPGVENLTGIQRVPGSGFTLNARVNVGLMF